MVIINYELVYNKSNENLFFRYEFLYSSKEMVMINYELVYNKSNKNFFLGMKFRLYL